MPVPAPAHTGVATEVVDEPFVRGAPVQRMRDIGRAAWFPYLLLVAIAFAAVAVHVANYTQIGPKDELQHIDYADKVSHFHFPRFPEAIGQRTLAQEACRGVDDRFKLPGCGATPYRNKDFPEGGLSTQTFHPPLYYALVGFPARALAAVLGRSGDVGMTRALGAVWLAIGLCAALAAGRRLGADTWATVALLAGIATTAQVLFAHSTVTNDATALCTGALALWAVVRYRGDLASAVVLLLVGFLAGGTKITNGFGVGTACLFALFAPSTALPAAFPESSRPTFLQRVRIVAPLAGGYAVANAIWALVFDATQLKAPRELSIFNRFAPKELTLKVVLDQISAFANPFKTYVPKMFNGPLMSTTGLLVSLAVLATAYSSWMLVARGRDTASILGACVSSLLLLGGPIQFLFVYFATSAGYTETRYSFSMLPAVAIAGGMLATRRSARVLVAIGSASVVATIGVGLALLLT